MAVTGVDLDDFGQVLRRFERWRTIAALLGQKPYDEPDFEDGRLYFRADYAEQIAQWPSAREQGDWGAYIIEPTPTGLYNVIRSLWHERDPERTEDLEAVFTQSEDAGKYIIAQIVDGIRVGLRAESQFAKWEEQGLSDRLEVVTPSERLIQYFVELRPGTKLDFARKYLKKFTVKSDPRVYSLFLPQNGPYAQVLVLSFDELDAELLDGLPLASVPPLRDA